MLLGKDLLRISRFCRISSCFYLQWSLVLIWRFKRKSWIIYLHLVLAYSLNYFPIQLLIQIHGHHGFLHVFLSDHLCLFENLIVLDYQVQSKVYPTFDSVVPKIIMGIHRNLQKWDLRQRNLHLRFKQLALDLHFSIYSQRRIAFWLELLWYDTPLQSLSRLRYFFHSDL